MTHETPDPEQQYDSGEDCAASPRDMSDSRYALPSLRMAVGSRRRTYSENEADLPREEPHLRHPNLRRRVKSGDDHHSRDYGLLHVKHHTRSVSILNGRAPEDRRPLLAPIRKIEVCLDTIGQVARCNMCNCTHSDSSSCDNSTSCSSQSCEKICSNPSGRDSFASCKKSNSDLMRNSCDLSQQESQQYSSLSELQNGIVNSAADPYYQKAGHVGRLPTVGVCNGHVPASLEQEEQADMLLEDDPVKAGENSKFAKKHYSTCRACFCLGILLFANMLNYMDRYTIAGVLIPVKSYYQIDNGQVGLLQTSFIVSYMVFSPIFGFLGDRYSRKIIMSVGIFSWSIITLASSFIGQDHFYVFLFMRALVGIGEASYSTIAPTIIADLFVHTSRTKALSVFYFAIPVGSGLGYIAGSKVASYMGDWKWALRITPGLGVLCVILILVVVREPQRGAAEGGVHVTSTSYLADLKYLCKHKSFLLSSAGFTCVAFVAGAMALWTPTYMYYSIRLRPEDIQEDTVSLIFGLITCGSGFTGVAVGSWSASKLRHTIGARADPLVCAFGLITCAPFLFLSLHLSRSNPIVTWVLIFIGETLLSLNWALVTDILLYIVVPTRRATAEAFQILMSHALGDAGSPYIIGQLSDHVSSQDSSPDWRAGQYASLQYSMYICCFVAVIGGGFFLATSLYIQQDKDKLEKVVKHARQGDLPSKPQMIHDGTLEAQTEDLVAVVT